MGSQRIPNDNFSIAKDNFIILDRKIEAAKVIQKFFRRYLYRKRAEARLKQAKKKKIIIQQQNKVISHRVLPDEVKSNNETVSKTIEDVIKIRKEAEDKAA